MHQQTPMCAGACGLPEIAVASMSQRPASRAAVLHSSVQHGSASDRGALSGSDGQLLAPSAGGPKHPTRATQPPTRTPASVATSSGTRQIGLRRVLASRQRALSALDARERSGTRIARHAHLALYFPVLLCVRVGQTAQARRTPDGGRARLVCRPTGARSRAEEHPRPMPGRGHRRTSQDCPRRYGSPHAQAPQRRSRENATLTPLSAKNRPEEESVTQPPRARCRSPCLLTAPAAWIRRPMTVSATSYAKDCAFPCGNPYAWRDPSSHGRFRTIDKRLSKDRAARECPDLLNTGAAHRPT